MAEAVHETFEGDGYAVGHIDGMGEGPAFASCARSGGSRPSGST